MSLVVCYNEHRKLVAESSEFQFMLIRAHKAHFSQLEIRKKKKKKKRDILSEQRENGMALKKREFTPESGSVDTYAMALISPGRQAIIHVWQ